MSTESNNNAVNVKCAIYARSAIGDNAAIENQVRLCRAFVQTQPNWSVCEGDIFTDGPASGLSTHRSGPQSLLEAAHAEPRPLDHLLVDQPCRLGRDLGLVAEVLGVLSGIGIALYCLSTGVVSIEKQLLVCVEGESPFRRTVTTEKPDSDPLI